MSDIKALSLPARETNSCLPLFPFQSISFMASPGEKVFGSKKANSGRSPGRGLLKNQSNEGRRETVPEGHNIERGKGSSPLLELLNSLRRVFPKLPLLNKNSLGQTQWRPIIARLAHLLLTCYRILQTAKKSDIDPFPLRSLAFPWLISCHDP